MAIAKYAIGCLNNSSYKPANFATMASVISNSGALSALASSSVAMSALASSSVAAGAIKSSIQNHRSKVVSALSDTSKFTKTSKTLGNGGSTNLSDGVNTNVIYIPVSCVDDGDTNFYVRYGSNSGDVVSTIAKHSGTISVTVGVSLRGVGLTADGGSSGSVTFDVYTVK